MRLTNPCLPALIAALFVLPGCGSDSTEPRRSTLAFLEVVDGEDQSGVVGVQLAEPLVVRVTDSLDNPVSGQIVNFVVTQGGGHVFAGSSLTNTDGLAQELWTLGTSTADSQRIEVRAVNPATGAPQVFAIFRATATADIPDTVIHVASDGQEGPLNERFADSLVVVVRDQYSNPVPGITVTWAVTSGGGTITPASPTTSSAGRSAAAWSPALEGAVAATATVTGLTPATFAGSAYQVLRFTQVSAGFSSTCGVVETGGAYCWGLNNVGQLGDTSRISDCDPNNSICRARPLPVPGGDTYSAVEIADNSACGLRGSAAFCWGSNYSGALGIGIWDAGDPPLRGPTAVVGGHAFTALSMRRSTACAITSAGAAFCFGYGQFGNLGAGSVPDSANAPKPVVGGLTFTSISAGVTHTCALTDAGAAYCWGLGGEGQLGDSLLSSSDAPLLVRGGHTFSKIAVGDSHTCGIEASGLAYCWGTRDVVGSATRQNIPFLVPGGHQFTDIAAGLGQTCAVTTTGAAYCWGISRGDPGSTLGDGTRLSRLTPTLVAGGHTFLSVSAGISHTCGVTTGKEIYCWGGNEYGSWATVLSSLQRFRFASHTPDPARSEITSSEAVPARRRSNRRSAGSRSVSGVRTRR